MAAIRYPVSITWGAATVHDDVTNRVHALSGIAVRYGRDQSRALSPMATGTASFSLINTDGKLLPENTGSPLYGYVRPGLPVTITAILASAGITAGLFSGNTNDMEILPDLDERLVRITCTDGLGRLRGLTVSTEVYSGLTSGQALHKLLDAAGWPASQRDIDPGASVFPWWWVSDGDAYDEATKIVDSEGPTALLTIDSANNIVFRGRHHRLTRAASITAQANWYGDIEPAMSPPIGYGHGWQDIINDVTFDVPIRVNDGRQDVVWSTQDALTIGSGETYTITASSSDPFINASVPVEGTDYTAVTGSVAVSLSRTSGASTTISLRAVAGVAVISGLQLRASLLTAGTTVQVKAQDIGSVLRYGTRSLPDDRAPVWASLPDVRGIAQMTLGQRSERLPTLSVTFRAGSTSRISQQLTRDLSDRVHIKDGVSYTDADFFIEQIEHRTDGIDHQTTFGCEKAPAQIANVMILGTGVLGTGRLGRRGIGDPATVFILGSSTNGKLGQNMLAA